METPTLLPSQRTAEIESTTTPPARFRVPGDIIAKTCEDLADEHRREVKWAAGYCRQKNLSCGDFGELLRQANGKAYSGDSVYSVFTGRRDEGSIENFARAVREVRLRVEETAPRKDAQFIETNLSRSIWNTCGTALRRQKLSFVFGPSQIGKTTALAAFAEAHNHGETVLVRMPTHGNLHDLIQEMAFRLGISYGRHHEMRRKIIESFDDRTLLLVDECHQCLHSQRSERALASLEFLREIYDRRRCGMVLCGTDIFATGLRSSKVLRQLWLRGYRPLQLPAVPRPADLAAFSRAFGLKPAPNEEHLVYVAGADDGRVTLKRNPYSLERDTVTRHGLGRWISILEDARDMAEEAGKPISWGWVIKAHAQFDEPAVAAPPAPAAAAERA